MSKAIYYGLARRSERKAFGILRITSVRPIQQEWTGEEFRSRRAAEARMIELNTELFGTERMRSIDEVYPR